GHDESQTCCGARRNRPARHRKRLPGELSRTGRFGERAHERPAERGVDRGRACEYPGPIVMSLPTQHTIERKLMRFRNRFCTFIIFGVIALRADEVTKWNLVATNAALAAGQSPPLQTRTYAIVHVAIHDALNAIDRRNGPYALETRAVPGASDTAAVAAAAHDTLIALIPSQGESIERAYSEALAGVPDGGARASGLKIGQAAAALILSRRIADGSNYSADWSPGFAPGQYRQTPPANATPILPHWGKVTPFALRTSWQYRVDPPPDLYSDRYAIDVNEIKLIGGASSGLRNDEQSEIARHWY